MAQATAVMLPNNTLFQTPTNKELARVSRTTDIVGSSFAPDTASAATYTWSTAEAVDVTYAAGTCNITLPDESAAGLANWPVNQARTLRKLNTSVNVIGITALTNVAYNLAAVNTAITTLIGSATVPGIATGMPIWTIFRASSTAYYIWPGI